MEENKEKNEQDTVEEVENTEQEIIDDPASQAETTTTEKDGALEKLEQEKDEIYQKYLRLQAEYDNFRKRTQKEKEADRKYRSQSLITELLPIVDNFERALQTKVEDDSAKQFVEGINMVYRQLTDVLQKEGVEEIETTGVAFDPHLHQAVMQVEDDNYDSNIVVEELQKGYKLKDKVIRPAMVKVNQ
ncbi:protein GrpE [Paraliobacillus ryukyuensis]|uniref:Protein GrpE n=1 Tax=Paraliobacillus ryukyuensis TaxID=200904 RepID=A0A366EG88_9BACI|nr:nucleotide exchange factor GrpE [Paraliobacillus ryukyuensis]RBP01343.1 molecular chaperone GrpE [Paraliobacillus ryukyuensis]